MKELTVNDDFFTEVSTGIVVVDFFATWCNPCKALVPILQRVVDKRPDIKILKINVETHADLAKGHNIGSIPHIVVYNNGVLTNLCYKGFRPKFDEILLKDLETTIKSIKKDEK